MVENLPTNAGDTGSSPGPGEIPHAAEQLGLCTTTTEPALYSPWSAIREAAAMTSLHTAAKSPRSPQLEKNPTRSNQDQMQPASKEASKKERKKN